MSKFAYAVKSAARTIGDRGAFTLCKGYKCEKVKIGECACTNIRNGLTTATHKRKTLSDAEIKARCTTCPAFPCDEYKYADANCNYWQSCADWILRADEENS
mmetsp:Transcript_42316/g.66276  ORF Transcript_42316/g.66276 Transcript_42316/m.66276 type:complete len:102 (+) Transcript_42316:64-369(+)